VNIGIDNFWDRISEQLHDRTAEGLHGNQWVAKGGNCTRVRESYLPQSETPMTMEAGG